MTFEKEFPGLKLKLFVVRAFEPVKSDGGMRVEIEAVSEQCFIPGELTWGELYSVSASEMSKLVMTSDVQEHCVDKQKVKEAIKRRIFEYEHGSDPAHFMEELLKELGLLE